MPNHRHHWPIITLLLLAPLIAEVLFGATRLSFIIVVLPEIGFWGVGALLIRYIARKYQLGWMSILLMGLALAIVEECLVQQTSLAPLAGIPLAQNYGRALGVNWVYLLWALIYESVYAVLVPIQLTELLFPSHRQELWLRPRGLIISTIVFAVASLVAGLSWRTYTGGAYHAPALAILASVIVIVSLIWLAFRIRPHQLPDAQLPKSPRPWLVVATFFALSVPWVTLDLFAYGAAPAIPVLVSVAGGLALVVTALWLIRRWSRSGSWTRLHRLSALSGAMCGNMLGGFAVFYFGGAQTLDVGGKLLLDTLALAGLFWLARDK